MVWYLYLYLANRGERTSTAATATATELRSQNRNRNRNRKLKTPHKTQKHTGEKPQRQRPTERRKRAKESGLKSGKSSLTTFVVLRRQQANERELRQ